MEKKKTVHERRNITVKVLIATFLSIYISIFLYSLLLPTIFMYDSETNREFWKKMIIVVNAVGPIAVVVVYLFYRPIEKAIKHVISGQTLTSELQVKTERAFKAIEIFLFVVGLFAYLVGAGLNLLLEIVKHVEIDWQYWMYRVLLASTFGLLNGIISARMVNLAWIDAKYRMGFIHFKDTHKKQSTLYKLGIPFVLILLVVSVFILCSVLYYIQYAQPEMLNSQFALKHFTGFAIKIFVITVVIACAILIENQAHIRHLQKQIDSLCSGTMDLSKRIFIISFDDIGYMTSGMNKMLENLQETFRAINKSELMVTDTSKDTKIIVDKSQQEAEKITKLISNVKDNEGKEIQVINNVVDDFEKMITVMSETIQQAQEQSAFIAQLSASMRSLLESFKGIGMLTLQANKRFEQLSQNIAEGEKGIASLIEANNVMVESNNKIKEMATMIMDISERSNLLAMNAAIEAAHAGAAGKGFAVVADEVRKLSQTTADSARQIDSFIKDIIEKNNLIDELNSKIKHVFASITEELSHTTTQMEEITISSQSEIVKVEENIKEIIKLNEISTELNKATQRLDAMKPEVSNSLEELEKITQIMSDVNEGILSSIAEIIASFNDFAQAWQKTIQLFKSLIRYLQNIQFKHKEWRGYEAIQCFTINGIF
ncbi:MAG TPA: methyl-accepting chemotaxis protein [Spirochaetales bacterium]|nr:methyl-accepting chemotaxis protein [Spirochaetales bacterium]